ncbi:MAG: DUF4345 domain-containing protein [Actinomycetota bacterium]
MSNATESTPASGHHQSPPSSNRTTSRHRALRATLLLVGLFIVFFSLNMSVGGFETLGWEGRADFVEVTNTEDYGMQDSHVRFASGVWTGLGLVFLAATRWLQELRTLVLGGLGVMFIGGLARLSAADASVLTSADILFALTLELIFVPLLAWWVHRSTSPNSNALPPQRTPPTPAPPTPRSPSQP